MHRQCRLVGNNRTVAAPERPSHQVFPRPGGPLGKAVDPAVDVQPVSALGVVALGGIRVAHFRTALRSQPACRTRSAAEPRGCGGHRADRCRARRTSPAAPRGSPARRERSSRGRRRLRVGGRFARSRRLTAGPFQATNTRRSSGADSGCPTRSASSANEMPRAAKRR